MIGSFSALPSCIADWVMSCPSATAMSSATFVASSKILLPLPVSLRMFVNVKQHVLALLDQLVINAGHGHQRLGQLADLLAGDLGRPAR